MNRLDRIKNAIANKSDLIEMKKSAIKNADAVFTPVSDVVKEGVVDKAESTSSNSNKLIKTVVLNTYNYMDSHEDVHLDGVFTKTIQERGPKGANKIFHLHDHEYKLTSKIGQPLDIYEKSIPWRKLGVDKDGVTTALVMESEIKKEWNERMYEAYKSGEVDQHSVGMQYVKIELAADDPDNAEAYKLYKDTLPMLGNSKQAEENGYFFVVKEARLTEGSAVLTGSNPITPTIKDEPGEPTRTEEPQDSTQKVEDLIKQFNKQFSK